MTTTRSPPLTAVLAAHWPPGGGLREALRYCALVTLTVRAALGLLVLVAPALLPQNTPLEVPGRTTAAGDGWAAGVGAWERWDALWYLRIAEDGYQSADGSAAFFPLYPLLVRLGAALPGLSSLGSALAISTLACFGALVVIHRLTEREYDLPTARRTVLTVAVFPTAVFLHAPYSESVFLLLAAGTFAALRSSRWAWAGALGALAALTRPVGVLLALPVMAAALEAAYRSGRGQRLRRGWMGLAAAGVIAAALAAYLGWWQTRTGEALRPLTAQAGWQREFGPPWSTLLAGVREGLRFPGVYPGGFAQLDLLLVGAVLPVALWVVLRTPRPYAVWVVASLLVPLSGGYGGRPFLSLPRFLLVLFPLHWGLARLALRTGAGDAIVAASAGLLALCTVLFASWYWIL